MINADDQELIMALVLGRITRDKFLDRCSVDPSNDPTLVIRILKDANERRDSKQIEYGLMLYRLFETQEMNSDILCALLAQDWHISHENIAEILQELRDPNSVDCLFNATFAQFSYLDYDESYALAVKCIWALGDIGSQYAREKLAILSSSDNKLIRENAEYQLNLDTEDRWKFRNNPS
jgi:hypothetical protein